MSALFAQCHISEKESVWLPQIQHLGEPLTVRWMWAAEKAAPEVTAVDVVARVLTGREQFASILAPRPSLVVIARDDAKQKMKKNEDDGVVVAAGKNVK